MNPKKKVSAKATKANSIKRDQAKNQNKKEQDSQSLISSKKTGTKVDSNLTNEKNELSEKIQKLDILFRKRIGFDQVLKQKAIDHTKEVITLEKLDRLLQRPEIVSTIGGLVQENKESSVTTIALVDPVTSQSKVLRDKIREIIHTLNELES